MKTADHTPYLAFPDGILHHVCAECDALCCRLGNFGGTIGREMGRVLNLYPGLQSSVYSQSGNYVSIIAPSSGCFFLDSDNLCRIEKDHGKSLKPSVCLLFPFNTINRIGNTVVISPHFKCPLRLVLPAHAGSVEGTHDTIKQMVRELDFMNEQYLETFAARLPFHPTATAEDVVSREVHFRDTCSERIGTARFSELLRDQSTNSREFDRNLSRSLTILGLSEDSLDGRVSHDNIDDLFVALAPTLRLNLLRLPADGILLALRLSEMVFRQTMSITSNPPTLQGAFTISSGIGPALRLIGLIDEPVGLNKSAPPNAPPGWNDDLKLAARMILRQAQGATGALELLERAIPPSFPTSDRSAVLLQIGRMIEHSKQLEESH